MSLPMQSTPTYTINIPSSKEQFKFRPFLVKEQKALLIAQQSENPIVMADTLKKVVASCAQSKIDVDKLAVFDLEYLFSQIRAKSVGETVEMFFFCDTCVDEKAKAKVSIDLTNLKVSFDKNHTNKIALFEDVGVIMKYPSIEILKLLEHSDGATNETDAVFNIIVDSIESIYDSNEMYHAKEQTKEELTKFINHLTTEQFAKIEQFFETMPKLYYDVDYTCPVCNKQHHKVLEGLNSFFY